MFRKLKSKANYNPKKLGKFFIFGLILLGITGFFFSWHKAVAAVKCTKKAGYGSYDFQYCEGLAVVLSPTKVKYGDTITFTLTVTDDQDLRNQIKDLSSIFLVGICNSSTDLPNDPEHSDCLSQDVFLQSFSATKNTFQATFDYKVGGGPGGSKISPQTAGTYKIGGALRVLVPSTFMNPAVRLSVMGLANDALEVSPSGNTGTPSISITQSQQRAIADTVSTWFNIVPQIGNLTVTKYKYYCDFPGTGTDNGTKNSFTCTHNLVAQDHKIVAEATLSDGQIIQSPVFTLTITGNENKRGDISSPDHTPSLLSFLNQIIGIILGFIQELLYGIFYLLIAPLIQAMLSIRTYSDGFAAVIYPGWVVIRNVCNIFFIVGLIAIGLGTLFRVESYQYKHLLVQLILAALLVNFSLVIGQAILGVADTVQSQFLPSNVGVIRSLAKNLMLAYRSDISIYGGVSFADTGYFANTVKPFFFLILSFGSFMVFLAIGAYLAIRIVMLWILLLISPVAYAAGVLPQTSKYRTEWWTTFLKYAFFTPIMAFFLNMAAVMVDASQTNPILKRIMSNPAEIGGNNIAAFVVSVASNVLLLVFLLVGLKVAEQASIFGASSISSFAKKGMFAPVQGAKFLGQRTGGLAARWYNNLTSKLVTDDHTWKGKLKKGAFAVLNPVNFARGWEERSKEKKEWAHEKAKGAGQVVASELLTLGKENINWKELAIMRSQRKMKSKFAEALGDDPDRATSMDFYKRILFLTDDEGQYVKGAASLLTNNPGFGDDTNELLFSPENIKKVRSHLAKGSEGKGLKLFDMAKDNYNDFGWLVGEYVKQGLDLDWLYEVMTDENIYERDEHGHFKNKAFEQWVSKEDTQRGLLNISAMTEGAKKVGHAEQMFGSRKDERIGKFIPLADNLNLKQALVEGINKGDRFRELKPIIDKLAHRSNETFGEWDKIDTRARLRIIPPHVLLAKMQEPLRDKDGNVKKDADGNVMLSGTWSMAEDVGDNFENLDAQQLIMWLKLGAEDVSRINEVQPRIIKNLAERYVDSEGNIRPEKARAYSNLIKLNADVVDAIRNVKMTGAPYVGKVGELDAEGLREEVAAVAKAYADGGEETGKAEAKRQGIIRSARMAERAEAAKREAAEEKKKRKPAEGEAT
jgi:hypothetical protein